MTAIRHAFLVVAVLVVAGLCAPVHAATPADAAAMRAVTLDNLQAAYNGESNARAKYLEFAKQADKDGYPSVASLFRAAADAEKVHADNHAEVIKKLGATPEAKIETPDVKTTEENLQAAISGETYERDTMYPEFVKNAKAAKMDDAVRTFNLARAAEAEHAKLYKEDLKDLASLKGKGPVTFYVCPKCGFTTSSADFSNCPTCYTSKEKFRASR